MTRTAYTPARDRVLASLAHKQPDRLPVDLASQPDSGMSAVAYDNLRKHIGIGSRTQIYDTVQQLAQAEDAILEHFRTDVIDIGRAFNTDPSSWQDITLPVGVPVQVPAWFHPSVQPDGSWAVNDIEGRRIGSMPKGASFIDQTYFPFLDGYPDDLSDLAGAMDKVLWSVLIHSPWDHASEPDFYDQLRQASLHLRATTDRALIVVFGGNLFEWGTFLRRFDNFLMDLAIDQANAERLLEALVQHHLGTLEKVCAAVGDVVDVIRFGDDLGSDLGPLFSPVTYRKLIKPRQKLMTDYVHANSSMKTFLHSCGSIHAFLPDLIEAGFDAINPVQITAKDMEPWRLKRDFGADITFWGGGADTRDVLPRGTPAEVKDHVRKNIETFAPGGGFVFATTHNMLHDVPPENIVAMYEAVDEYR